jgi:ABC-type Fe3+ transport system permease subunit
MKGVVTESAPRPRNVTRIVFFVLAGLAAVLAIVVAVGANDIYQSHSGLGAELLIPNDAQILSDCVNTELVALAGGGLLVLVLVLLGALAHPKPPKVVHIRPAPAAGRVIQPGRGWDAQRPLQGGPAAAPTPAQAWRDEVNGR